MRRALLLAAIAMLGACHRADTADAVRQAYDNRASAVDNAADAQPTAAAKRIYRARADALREEGRDREEGLKGGQPSGGQGAGAAATGSGQ